MKFLHAIFTVSVILLWADTIDTMDIHLLVDDIRELVFDTTYLDFNVSTVTAGALDPVTLTTTYDITSTSVSPLTIQGRLDEDISVHDIALDISLSAPPGATSAGNVTLTTTFQNLVTAILEAASTNLAQHTTIRPLSATQVPSEGSYVFTIEFVITE
ncbi:MAG: hypothetical protein MRY21_02870 [Simkaniaceae bacterium]|nr:hypothetical protein [Simkaniaceae bacterium]